MWPNLTIKEHFEVLALLKGYDHDDAIALYDQLS
jgi:hypothetical protein